MYFYNFWKNVSLIYHLDNLLTIRKYTKLIRNFKLNIENSVIGSSIFNLYLLKYFTITIELFLALIIQCLNYVQ